MKPGGNPSKSHRVKSCMNSQNTNPPEFERRQRREVAFSEGKHISVFGSGCRVLRASRSCGILELTSSSWPCPVRLGAWTESHKLAQQQQSSSGESRSIRGFRACNRVRRSRSRSSGCCCSREWGNGLWRLLLGII